MSASALVTGVLLRAYDIPIVIGREEARRRAEEELAKAKYGGTPDWVTSALNRTERLAEWLIELLGRLAARPGSGGGVNWGFVIVVVALLVLIALVVWRVGLPRWRRRAVDAAVATDPTLAPADYRTSAAALASAGDWRGAVRDRFRALVRELETRTVLDERPARTALEAAATAGRQLPDVAAALWQGAEEFNAVLYGDRPADAAAYARMVELDEQVVAAADADTEAFA